MQANCGGRVGESVIESINGTSFSTHFLRSTFPMYKSSKRIRLEREIFSKLIKEIEQMFNFSNDDDSEFPRKQASRDAHSHDSSNNSSHTNRSPMEGFSRLDLPAGTRPNAVALNYDCVNMAFLLDTQSEVGGTDLIKPPVLPLTSLIPGKLPELEPTLPRSVLWDYNDDDVVEEYTFELDLKVYMPRINLEQDLKMIDQMFAH